MKNKIFSYLFIVVFSTIINATEHVQRAFIDLSAKLTNLQHSLSVLPAKVEKELKIFPKIFPLNGGEHLFFIPYLDGSDKEKLLSNLLNSLIDLLKKEDRDIDMTRYYSNEIDNLNLHKDKKIVFFVYDYTLSAAQKLIQSKTMKNLLGKIEFDAIILLAFTDIKTSIGLNKEEIGKIEQAIFSGKPSAIIKAGWSFLYKDEKIDTNNVHNENNINEMVGLIKKTEKLD